MTPYIAHFLPRGRHDRFCLSVVRQAVHAQAGIRRPLDGLFRLQATADRARAASRSRPRAAAGRGCPGREREHRVFVSEVRDEVQRQRRSTHCPTCKEPFVVPSADPVMAYAPPPGRIDGTPSSLAQAGVEGGVTLAGDFATAEALSLQNLIDGKQSEGARYVVESPAPANGTRWSIACSVSLHRTGVASRW
jgi:hypothetical protein